MFDGMIKEILDQVGELSSQNTELCALLRNVLQVQLLLCACFSRILKTLTTSCFPFQAMVQVIDALSRCVRHVGTFEEAPDLDSIRSLPSYILRILRGTFQHCKVGVSGSGVAVMNTF